MNHTSDDERARIETRLERSLRSQVRVPKLDGRFDAAVWARIEKATANAAVAATPAPTAASRWLFASNVAGVLIAVVLVGVFGARAFSGVEVASVGVDLSLPQVAPGIVEIAMQAMIWTVTALALGVGLMFTSLGRRLRSEFF